VPSLHADCLPHQVHGMSAHACGVLAAALPGCPTLERLDLSMNPFGDMGAWGLAWALPECSRLRELDLSSCEVGDDGADELLEALDANTTLATLDLRGNKIHPKHVLGRDVARVRLEFQRPVLSSVFAV